ncbi:MAG: glycosyltransferase N-terminal domain-containing protein [Candidatus Zophobacter franzmannii]|jgi:3-deoxy-D-manno-octulosonic-acid transferase|nr:glycosyltransferase N-terminal domain-containing protein [Candidatus Zophobacter franzmannii]
MFLTQTILFILNIFLDLIYIAAFPILSLIWRDPISNERLGLYPPKLNKPIWIHAASVGEVNAIIPLLNELLNIGKPIFITTTSRTGRKRVKDLNLPVTIQLLPLDIRLITWSFMHKLKPSMLLIVETEIWPNLLLAAINHKVPVGWVNARIAKSSVEYLNIFKFVFKPLFQKISFVSAQTGVDTRRFRKLGFSNVTTAGNLKFCLNLKVHDPNKIKQRYGIDSSDFVIVWGSSRPGEEELLIKILPRLEAEIKDIKTIVVPRHLNRMEDVCKVLGPIPFTLFSKHDGFNYKLLTVDKMGVLTELYSIADIAIIGGSFRDFGGHNPLEAAFYGKPIIIGPYYTSCRGSVRALKHKHAILFSDEDKLFDDIMNLYNNESTRKLMGDNAKKTLEVNCQSLSNNLTSIKKLLI